MGKMPISVLTAKVAQQKGLQPFQVQLLKENELLTVSNGAQTLGELGIEEGVTLTLVRRTAICLQDLGDSRFNKDYYCTVSKAEQVGQGSLAVDFKVNGNMSLGKLQNPSHSTLTWRDDGSASDVVRKVAETRYTNEDWNRCIEGTLFFADIPMDRTVYFRFGSAGYSNVPI